MAKKLIFKDAEKARDSILKSQQKEIEKLYLEWADEIGKKAEELSHKNTPSALVQERQLKELKKQLEESSKKVANEVYSKIKSNMYKASDAVVGCNAEWMKSLGFDENAANVMFTNVPDSTVRNLVTGQIYDSGWSLSKAIWGDNEKTLKDIYKIVAKGVSENKTTYDIAKELESYVNPNKKLPWNTNGKDGVRIYKKKVDYNAQRLARTLVQHSYQQSFIATTKDNPFVQDYVWLSNGSRVCPICKARNGKHFSKDKLPMDHPNGMCVMVPAISPNMTKDLADWVKNPSKHPEIDKFAKKFGYDENKAGNVLNNYKEKFGNSIYSDKMKSAFGDKYDEAKKAMVDEFYKNGYESTAQFLDDYYDGKIKSNILDDLFNGASKNNKKFNKMQEKYLKPYGFSEDNMPATFSDWSHKLEYGDGADILESMGTNWSDPHPYQKLMKFFDENLAKLGKGDIAENIISKDDIIKELEAYDVATLKSKLNHINAGEKYGEAFAIIKKEATSNNLKMNDYIKLYMQNEVDSKKLDEIFSDAIKAKNIAKATDIVEDVAEEVAKNKVKKVKIKSYTWLQEKYLKKHGYDYDNMPSYEEWVGVLSEKELNQVSKYASEKGLFIDEYFEKFIAKVKYKYVDENSIDAQKIINDAKQKYKDFNKDEWYKLLKSNDEDKFNDWYRKWRKKLTAKEVEGVRTYTGSAYRIMNGYLRGIISKSDAGKYYLDSIDMCKKALEKSSLPEEVIVRRGSSYGSIKRLLNEASKDIMDVSKEYQKYIGSVVEDKGFLSTSPDPYGGFSDDVEYIIKVPKGAQAMYVDLMSKHQGEKELLINAGSKFVIKDIELNDAGNRIKKVFMEML